MGDIGNMGDMGAEDFMPEDLPLPDVVNEQVPPTHMIHETPNILPHNDIPDDDIPDDDIPDDDIPDIGDVAPEEPEGLEASDVVGDEGGEDIQEEGNIEDQGVVDKTLCLEGENIEIADVPQAMQPE